MLREAISIIRELHSGELVDHQGEYFQVDSARIWDLPEQPVEIAVAVGRRQGDQRDGTPGRPPDRHRAGR